MTSDVEVSPIPQTQSAGRRSSGQRAHAHPNSSPAGAIPSDVSPNKNPDSVSGMAYVSSMYEGQKVP